MEEYSKNPRYPFHMPGHKGGRLCSFSDVYKFDITEIDDYDNLHNPEGIIKNSQERASKLFESDYTFFMVNGSSGGNMAAILSVCGDGDKIIVARNSHKSVFSGIVLSGADVRYVYPEVFNDTGIVGQVTVESIEKSLGENPDTKAVFITSPTYEGFTADIEKIADLVHKNNAILIVDEAHGAHFNFNDYFPGSAIKLGADIVIQSVHKTLPSVTQTALMHIKGDRVNIENIKSALAMVQSSSPSYIFMSSIDRCCDFIEKEGKYYFDKYVDTLKEYREKFKTLKNIKIIGEDFINICGVKSYDKGKLVFIVNDTSTEYINKILIEKYNIQLEAVGRNHIIAMTSVADTKEGFERLFNALCDIDKHIKYEKSSVLNYCNVDIFQTVSLRKAYFLEKEKVSLYESVGKICGDFLIPYPPGIPVLCPGEVITSKALECICEFIDKGINVLGVDESFGVKVLCQKEK